jgi:nucleoside-diphosphate-sugar epimerase
MDVDKGPGRGYLAGAMKVLVTGATGHLGANLVRRLIEDGHDVRTLELAGDPAARALDDLPVERTIGDLRDIETLHPVVRGVDRIYHTAAIVSTLEADEPLLFAANVLGTRNLLRAARQAGVPGRIVVTGSFSAVGHREDGAPCDEDQPFNPFGKILPYEKSKAGVEHEALKAVIEGQDVVIATSCAIIGPHDYVPSRMGRTIRDYANGKLRAYLPGGFPFVAARDIVEGHVLAMQRGRTGQKYIIASEYRSTDDWMDMLERVTGRKRPVRLPTEVMLPIAMVSEAFVKAFAPRYPLRFTPGAVRILSLCRKADTTKAQAELGFVPTRVEDAVREAYEWFVRDGQIRRPRRVAAAPQREVAL